MIKNKKLAPASLAFLCLGAMAVNAQNREPTIAPTTAPSVVGLPPCLVSTPVNISLTDIRPFVKAGLNTLPATATIRANGDAITKAHYEDLAVSINEILDPKK